MKALGLPLLACLALQPGLVAAKDDPDLRGDTETMEALLDKVVRRVSQPSAAPFFGATEAARAYRLQGFGVVFVVPPRALPRSDRAGLAPRGGKVTRLLAPQEGRSPVSPDELAKALAREDALRTSLTVDSAPDTKVRAARERDLAAIEAKVEAEYGRPLPPPGPEEPVSPASRFLDLWIPGIRGRVILMSVFNIFQTIGFYGFNNWVPSLLIKQGITVSTSLGYTTVIALAAPLGPLLGFFLGDRLERKWIIVASAAAILACGLVFGQTRDSALIIAMGVALTLAANIMSFSFHAYQQELFPTGIRARAAGFVYSWSRLSVIFSSFIIAFILNASGAFGVFVFIAAAMGIVMATIGIFGPRTTNLALEEIAR